MSVWDWMRECKRLWILIVVGIILTASLAIYSARTVTTVYWTQQTLVFLAPNDPVRPNALESTTESLIATAGLVERTANANKPETLSSSADIRMIDEGIYTGWTVRLPNSGGQWATNFDRPELILEAAGADPQAVLDTLKTARGLVQSSLDSIQEQARVGPENFIRIEPNPAEPAIALVSGNHTRAALVVTLIGAILTLSLVGLLTLRRHRANISVTEGVSVQCARSSSSTAHAPRL